MNINSLISRKKDVQLLGFLPKNNSEGIYQKKYINSNYIIEIDFDTKFINYGSKIKSESKTTQNFSQEENWVVLECVNRLLDKGYEPEDLILEKVYRTGHGHSGRLDILVLKDKKAFLMIECKTFGSEFKKEFQNLNKNGGQLFTYFQQDRNVEYLILYGSTFEQNKIQYVNKIIKIEDSYRETSNVPDLYERWSKLTTQNGLFDEWVNAYEFKSKALTLNQLKIITQTDSSFIFNRFLEILRHNVVSDKPNAFNKIFTLFLCKIVDENRNPDEQLDFQWIEGIDDNISFQKRLTDLYKKGMQELLSKDVTDISDDEFNKKYGSLDDTIRENILKEITKIRLQKNNEFAIKEVFDEETFEENSKVLKEVVELLQIYKIRYAEKQQYLSDFFELLLNTGLKQESGQFFTPIPVARFICRSIPLNKIIQNKLLIGDSTDLLPTTIDYATGSGHFLTESMNEIQNIIQITDETKLKPRVKLDVSGWKLKPFSWAYDYVYGVEKDYRLVKTAKVGCYLHGDGVAQVIHTDGLNNFNHTKEYQNKLNGTDNNFSQDNKKFDIVISNPPYSVSAFKTNLKREFAEKDFELYKYLTDQSSEIECLFIERTKQLLKDEGIAGIILPSSMLSNTGIYTKTREILLKYFNIVGITELGSNTFMATGTNTVILFIKRKNNYGWINIQDSINKFSSDLKDITVNGIENVFSKYVKQVYKNCSFKDYISIFKIKPNELITKHELFCNYKDKINSKNEEDLINKIIELEKEKLLYFILTYPQKIVLVKSGEKNIEKTFLGYGFSNRRGSEGIHPIQSGKMIDECTKLYDPLILYNPTKTSTYILDAFENKFDREIDDELKNHVSRIDLIDMMTWDRMDFDKNISLTLQEKIEIESKWEFKKINNCLNINCGNRIIKNKEGGIKYPVYGGGDETFRADIYNRENKVIISRFGMSPKCVRFISGKFFLNDSGFTVEPKLNISLQNKFVDILMFYIENMIYSCGRGPAQKNIDFEKFKNIKIPIPPKNIQEKIIKEIEELEKKEKNQNEEINKYISQITEIINASKGSLVKLEEITVKIGSGATPRGGESSYKESGITLIRSQNIYDNKFHKKGLVFIDEEQATKLNNVSVEPNDVLFNITGASVARCCIVDESYLPARVNQHVAIIRVNEKASPKYIQQILISSQIKKDLLSIAKSSSTREAITKSQLEDFKILLPSLPEQNKMVEQIEIIECKISKLENQIKKLPKLKEKVLKKYL